MLRRLFPFLVLCYRTFDVLFLSLSLFPSSSSISLVVSSLHPTAVRINCDNAVGIQVGTELLIIFFQE